MNYYAGIGSRTTPPEVTKDMTIIASLLEKEGLILRSGGAKGADEYFELGVKNDVNKEIYLPWQGFNNSDSSLISPDTEAYEIAERFHPSWYRLSQGARKLQARNSHQVLGKDLNTPSKFIVCWTEDAKMIGGTAQAIRIANHYSIPVFNLAIKPFPILEVDHVKDFVNKLMKL